MRKLFVIPARAGSKRLPGKNEINFSGKPLYQHTVNFVMDVANLNTDSCIVTTDILGVPDYSADNDFFISYSRPNDLSRDDSTSNDTIMHAINHASSVGRKFDIVILLQVTSPLRTKDGYLRFLKSIEAQENRTYQCHASVSRLPVAPYELGIIGDNCSSFKIFSKPLDVSDHHWKGQSLGFEDGCFYASFKEFIRKHGSFTETDLYSFHFAEKLFQVDIDNDFDMKLAKRLF